MIKLDFKKFKKVSDDKDKAVMRHEDGHEVHIAKKALTPKFREQLAALPMMADGGKVQDNKKQPENDKRPLVIEKLEDKRPLDIEPVSDDEIKKLADGGPSSDKLDVQPVSDSEAKSLGIDLDPLDVQPASDEEMKADDAKPAQATGLMSSLSNGASGSWDSAQPQDSNSRAPAAAPSESPGVPAPDLMGGYSKQIQGINQAAQAEGAMGDAQAKDLQQNIARQKSLQDIFQSRYKELNDERLNHIDDINAGKIDPKKYWDDHSKIMTGLGIILAGFNPTNRPNAAIEFLNQQMDRNLNAQAQNLNSKQNLLSANLRQFGNLKDATDMTRVMQSDMLSNQLKVEAAKATNPLAKARALQTAGALESQVAPTFLELAMRQSALQQQVAGGNNSGQVSSVDPASYVPFLVKDPGRQKDILHEIGQAQLTAKNSDEILKNFDEATKENTFARTGAGLLRTPASILNMRAMMLPIIHDAEGRVNEFEQRTTSDLEPKPGDTDAKIAAKKQGLINFLRQKQVAPNAKAAGIDLTRFASTAADKVGRLPPQQQAFVKWARENPSDPRSKVILNKLGVE